MPDITYLSFDIDLPRLILIPQIEISILKRKKNVF